MTGINRADKERKRLMVRYDGLSEYKSKISCDSDNKLGKRIRFVNPKRLITITYINTSTEEKVLNDKNYYRLKSLSSSFANHTWTSKEINPIFQKDSYTPIHDQK